MNEQYKTGDIVEVLDNGTAGKHMKGVTARVVEGNEDGADYVFVEDPTGDGLFTQYGDTTSWIIDNENLRLVETKQEETPVKQELKVGDTVRVLKTSSWHKLGETGKVQSVSFDDTIRVNDWWISPKEVELVTEKPKTKSQEIELEDVQVGDTVVAFWNLNGVEYRQKGTVAEINSDGEPITDEGNFVVHTGGASRAYSFGTLAEHIYLIERPEPKPEPKPEDALDRAKTYVAEGKKMGYAPWYLKHIGGEWRFSSTKDVNESSAPVRGVEDELLEATSVWEKPVEYVEPPKTIQEQLDDLGVKATDLYRYEGADVMYKFYGVGRVSVFGPEAQFKREVTRDDLGSIRDGYLNKI